MTWAVTSMVGAMVVNTSEIIGSYLLMLVAKLRCTLRWAVCNKTSIGTVVEMSIELYVKIWSEFSFNHHMMYCNRLDWF